MIITAFCFLIIVEAFLGMSQDLIICNELLIQENKLGTPKEKD